MTETNAVSPAASPWGEPAAPPAPPAKPSGGREIIWGVISTAMLVAWIGWQVGWIWGVVLVFGVFVHEFGHLLVINSLGSGPSHIRIIPFFGGAATMSRPPDTDLKGVVIAVAGPVFGLLAALPFFALTAGTRDPRWLGGAYLIAGLNLLNLAPAPPLDGAKALGPVLARIHPRLELVALVVVGALAAAWAFSRGSIILPVFIVLSVLGSIRAGRLRPFARPLSWLEWGAGLCLYGGAVAICFLTLVLAARGSSLATPDISLFGGRS